MPSSSGNITPLQTPTTPPRLIVSHSEARQKLESHIEKGQELVRRLISSEDEMDIALAEGDKWRDYAIRLLATLFDTPSLSDEYREKTRRISFPLYGRPSYIEERDDFKKRVNNRVKELESIQESLDLIQESPVIGQRTSSNTADREKTPQTEALEKIELIANRFHIVARQLRHRHNDRPTLIIENEYDMQDLFHALLRLFFEDIRNEEWTPGYAGGASRIDFLLKAEQVVIELKMTRAGLKAKEVSDQLIIDTDRYRAHPDCKMLLAFVYDPQEYLNNPRGIEHDLTKTTNNVPVKVIINPH